MDVGRFAVGLDQLRAQGRADLMEGVLAVGESIASLKTRLRYLVNEHQVACSSDALCPVQRLSGTVGGRP